MHFSHPHLYRPRLPTNTYLCRVAMPARPFRSRAAPPPGRLPSCLPTDSLPPGDAPCGGWLVTLYGVAKQQKTTELACGLSLVLVPLAGSLARSAAVCAARRRVWLRKVVPPRYWTERASDAPPDLDVPSDLDLIGCWLESKPRPNRYVQNLKATVCYTI
jgi:hypothetical protein